MEGSPTSSTTPSSCTTRATAIRRVLQEGGPADACRGWKADVSPSVALRSDEIPLGANVRCPENY